MLKKCLKYDLKSIWRIWWIIAASMMAAALVASGGFRLFSQTAANPNPNSAVAVLASLSIIPASLCIFVMIAGVVISLILVYWRIYTHFFTDEGYLTFTLPVKRSTLYLSKVLTALIVQVATVLVLIVGIGFMCLLIPPTEAGGGPINPVVFRELGHVIAQGWETIGAWMIVYALLVLVLMVLLALFSTGMVFLCMTIGSIVAKKHKLLAAIGIYYAVHTVLSFASSIFSLFGMEGLIVILAIAFEDYSATAFIPSLIPALALTVFCLLCGCLAAVVHFISLDRLEQRLNLA